VPDFAERLATAAGLPYVSVLSAVKRTEEQSKLENSRKQWLNVQGAFTADRTACPPGAVLLVDDLIDSKWTITEAGGTLRRAGVPGVVPFALAASGLAS
ncbi:MAG: RecQ family ATP-dependent DNA helicase, partial [Solirubrobacterales bacterium]